MTLRAVNQVGLTLFAALALSTAEASDFQSPRTAALGGSGHAGPMLNDAIYLNPSYASFLPSYGVALNYAPYVGGAARPEGGHDLVGHILNASLQDGHSDLFQAGVGYTQRPDLNIVNFGAARQAVRQLGYGVGGKFVKPPGTAGWFDSNLSVTGVPTGLIQLSFMVDNLIESDKARSYGFVREFTLGTKLNLKGVAMIYFDPHLTPNLPVGQSTFGHETGIEFTMMQDLFLRLGLFHNAAIPIEAGARGRGYGIGAGWMAPRISIDYGLQRVIEPVQAVAHVFGFTAYF